MQKMYVALTLAVVATAVTAATPEDARTALHASCPGLKKYSTSLTWGSPIKQAASQDAQCDRKWKEVYQFKVVVSGSPSAKVINEYKAQGQSCYFDVAAGDAEEVSVAKAPCQAICKDKVVGAGYIAYFGVDGSAELKR